MAKSEKRLVKSKSGMRMISVDEKISSPFTKEEPPWVPDNSVRRQLHLLAVAWQSLAMISKKLFLG